MIGYVTIGTNDLDKAAVFYDALFETIGAQRILQNEQFIAWSTGADQPGISVTKPFDGKAAKVGNGNMIAIPLDTQEKVNAFHKKAIELGATDEGSPGPRGDMTGFYAGYFRDLDGNKLNAFYFARPSM
jgi:catechol 2,3-dioxygenase-like lactoylglutathione lyase family enzyme|tara:strand:- start:2589 stop:2975 length:387 start_codon:yes stop_codon:yes gene_type:complete